MARNYTGGRVANPNESKDSEGGEGGGTSLRIDRWLWCTRLFKSRSLAAEAVAGGKVHVNGRRVKPALAVRVGDRVAITRPGYQFECEVLKLPDRRGSAPIAQSCYTETDVARAAREKFAEQARLAAAFAPRSPERPDKHGRRVLRRLRGRD
jgi:ribosome-associated heat shock protein Hsp15